MAIFAWVLANALVSLARADCDPDGDGFCLDEKEQLPRVSLMQVSMNRMQYTQKEAPAPEADPIEQLNEKMTVLAHVENERKEVALPVVGLIQRSSTRADGFECAGPDCPADEVQTQWSPSYAESDLAEAEKKEDSCTPQCMWKCESVKCDRVCTPVCGPPKCQTRCTGFDTSGCRMKCNVPQCSVECPRRGCPTGNCPLCQTKCTEPVCAMQCRADQKQPCRSVCAQPDCHWRCTNPVECPKPKCHMVCEHPKNCFGSMHHEMPELQKGEFAVTHIAYGQGKSVARSVATAPATVRESVATAPKPFDTETSMILAKQLAKSHKELENRLRTLEAHLNADKSSTTTTEPVQDETPIGKDLKCGEENGGCLASKCCNNALLTCYEQSSSHAECRVTGSCPKDGTWTCNILSEATTTPAPGSEAASTSANP